eukprot:2135553-Amphidinium_carterae.1
MSTVEWSKRSVERHTATRCRLEASAVCVCYRQISTSVAGVHHFQLSNRPVCTIGEEQPRSSLDS